MYINSEQLSSYCDNCIDDRSILATTSNWKAIIYNHIVLNLSNKAINAAES